MTNLPDNKQHWLKLLLATEIPSFGESIQKLSNAEIYSSQHAAELARTILKDPNLTASALKLANSAHFNRQGGSVNTVSRSLMVLGFDSIKEICASCLLIESFLESDSSINMKALIVRSFHAATQAKQIALLQGQKMTEEIFISALLLNIGELAVYSAMTDKPEFADQLISNYPIMPGQEKTLLGCYFNDLTIGLCEAWHIAPMVGELFAGHYAEDSPVRSVFLGNSFAMAFEISGAEIALNKHAKSLMRYTGKSLEVITEKMQSATKETRVNLKKLGLKLEIFREERHRIKPYQPPFKVETDKASVFEVLSALSCLEQQQVDVNQVLLQLIKGIKQCAGFSSVLVALLNPERTQIYSKHAIEQDGCDVKSKFNFDCSLDIPEIYQPVILERNIIESYGLRKLGITAQQLAAKIGNSHQLWGPLIVENKVIGCFYADNGINGEPIKAEQRDIFKLLICYARLLLLKLK